MAKFLTEDWLEIQHKLAAETQPTRPGVNVRLQWIVTGGETKEIRYFWVLADGRLEQTALGTLDEPEVTLTLSYADAVAIQEGKLEPSAAFMQGRVKVLGNPGKLMTMLPITSSPEFKDMQTQLRSETEY